VIAVFDLATGTGETLPATPLIPSFAVAGAAAVGIGAGSGRAIVAVSEAGQKRDLNNDFDQVDAILAWIDTKRADGAARAPDDRARGADARDRRDARSRRGIGRASGFQGTDLNLDGDKADTVLFLVDTNAARGRRTSFALATSSYALTGVDAFVGVDEAAQGGGDLNGNGIATDTVQFYIDLGDPVPAPRGLGIVATSRTFFRLTPDEVRSPRSSRKGSPRPTAT